MKKVLALRGQARLIEETLTDGSKVYDVTVGNVTFHGADVEEARFFFNKISLVSKTIMED